MGGMGHKISLTPIDEALAGMRSQVLQFFDRDVPICKRLLPFPIAATLIGISCHTFNLQIGKWQMSDALWDGHLARPGYAN